MKTARRDEIHSLTKVQEPLESHYMFL
jgi:hypothetical protein